MLTPRNPEAGSFGNISPGASGMAYDFDGLERAAK
jgi:hypothetical protein